MQTLDGRLPPHCWEALMVEVAPKTTGGGPARLSEMALSALTPFPESLWHTPAAIEEVPRTQLMSNTTAKKISSVLSFVPLTLSAAPGRL